MKKLLALALALVFLAGCGVVTVKVRAYQSDKAPWIPKGAAFYVAPYADAAPSLLDDKIRSKISDQLTKSGYALHPVKTAQYVLAYKYQIGAASAGVYTNNVTGNVESYSRHTRSMFLQVLTRDGPKWRPIWEGHAISTGSSSDIDLISTYLLKALFQYFGKETKGQEPVFFPYTALP